MFDVILNSPWAGPLLWAAVYISDYYFTIACARLYRAQDKILVEGSFEITPAFQKDVDTLRRFSPKFCLHLTVSTAYLFFIKWLAAGSEDFRAAYVFVLGAMLLLEATVHARHLRNLFLYKTVVHLLRGRLEYPRAIMLKMSALELLIFSGLYAALFFVTGSLFLLGGAFTCGFTAIKHYRLVRRCRLEPAKAV